MSTTILYLLLSAITVPALALPAGGKLSSIGVGASRNVGNNISNNSDSKSGISKGAIIGIAVGCAAAVALVAGALYLRWRRGRRGKGLAEADTQDKMATVS